MLATLVCAASATGCGSSSSEQSGAGTNGTETAPIGAAAAGCKDGGGGVRQLRVTNAECVYARGVAADWVAKRSCQGPAGASRTSCAIGSLRCLGVRTEQGIAVTCAQPGRSISFVARRG